MLNLLQTQPLLHIAFHLCCRCICRRLCCCRCRHCHHCCCHHCCRFHCRHDRLFRRCYCCHTLVDCCLPPPLPLFTPAAAVACPRCCNCCQLVPLLLLPPPQPLPLFLPPPPPPPLPNFLPLAPLPLCFHHHCFCFHCCHATAPASVTIAPPLLFPMPLPP